MPSEFEEKPLWTAKKFTLLAGDHYQGADRALFAVEASSATARLSGMTSYGLLVVVPVASAGVVLSVLDSDELANCLRTIGAAA